MGGYERDPAPWSLDGIPPDFNGRLLEEDWPRFEPLLENAVRRVPGLEEMEVVRLINGPEAFTPDGEFILGPTDVRGFWVAAGFCAHGLAGAGGMGKLVAEWIVEETPSLDVWQMDSRRFGAAYRTRAYTVARTTEVYSTYYDVKYPGHEREAGRPLRLSPAYPRLEELGASFGEKSGWERANWFEPNAAAGDESLRPRGWAGRHWSPAIGAEHRACREAAALFDESSFAKIEVSGEGAAELLEWLCDNRVARDVGAITYTQMLNARGGIECDFTVTRLAEERFRIVTGTAFGRHDLAWIRQHAPDDGSVTVDGRHVRVRLPRALGPEGARDPRAADDGSARLPVHAGARARRRPRAVPRAAGHVRRRARLGALLPVGVRAQALGHDLGGRPRARARRGRLQGDRLASAREGLPRLGSRHHGRRHAPRGRARLRGQARQGLSRQGGARRGRRAGAAPRLRDALRPAPSRSAPSRCASRASSSGASRAAATATRSAARSRTPTCRTRAPSPARRSRSRSSASGSTARLRRAAVRPEGERLRGSSRSSADATARLSSAWENGL